MIMTCPKCKGSGKEWIDTTFAPYSTACHSCCGLGYVTDQPSQPETKIIIVNNTPYVVRDETPPAETYAAVNKTVHGVIPT